jgi:hypothetical protein
VEIPPGDGRTWQNISAPVKEVTGVLPIWLYFTGPEGLLIKLDWFVFGKNTTLEIPIDYSERFL